MTTNRAIIVCGSRDLVELQDGPHVRFICRELFREAASVVIHGDARGGDAIAKAWARRSELDVIAMPAMWRPGGKLDRAAGHKRNAAMLRVLLALRECGYDVAVWAFPLEGATNKGTQGMVAIALRAKVEVHERLVPVSPNAPT